jgi:SecD/SecF fusion protein
MSTLIKSSSFNFLKFGKLAFVASILLVVAGAAGGVSSKKTIFGMDFTGGFSLSFELQPKNSVNYRETVENALKAKGLSNQEFQVRELSPSNHIRVFLTKNLDQEGKPFFNLPVETDYDVQFSYENNPRILWIVEALKEKDLTLTQASLEQLSTQWTSVSGQISKTMQNNAYFGLGLALLCILLYITFRFEFKYAIAATLGLLHDVFITIGTICILHVLGVPLQIELVTIAALMAIIGYSLNDTIIIFDRIREDLKIHKKMSFKDVCNQALNVTLSRTIMTSGTTILVLLALVCFGGSTIFGFALVMTIGILYGTLSSLFIAAPLLFFLEQKTSKKNYIVVKAP